MIVKRYIRRSLYATCGFLLLAFFAIQTLLNFSKEFSTMGSGLYDFGLALRFVLLSNIIDLYAMFPYIALLSSLLALNHLHKHHEIIVMQVSGLSTRQLCWTVFVGALLLTLGVTVVGEGLGPILHQHAVVMKAKALNRSHVLTTGSGIWIQDDHEFYFISQVTSHQGMKNITRYVDRGHRLVQISQAKSARYRKGVWHFYQVRQTQLLPSGNVKNAYHKTMVWPLTFNPKTIAALVMKPDQLSLPAYYHSIRERSQVGTISPADRLAFWRRFFQPLQTLTMFFLAIPFALSTIRQSQTGLKVMIGVLFGFFCYFFTHLMGSVAVINGVPAWISGLVPIFILAIVGIMAVYFQANKIRLFSQYGKHS